MVQYKLEGEPPKMQLGRKGKMSLLEHSVLQLFPLTVCCTLICSTNWQPVLIYLHQDSLKGSVYIILFGIKEAA